MGIAFVFPGQGSQYIGMYSGFLSKKEFEKYFDVIKEILGKNFVERVEDGPEEVLKDTRVSQPAIFSVSCMLADYLKDNGIIPKCVAGHSLGEYSAFYSAGVFDFEGGLKLVKKRAEIMNEIAQKHDGGMWAVIGGNLEEIEESLKGFQGEELFLWAANYNSPGQIVLSGNRDAFNIWYSKMKEKVKRVISLSVSGPFHSPLMKEAEEIFKETLEGFKFDNPKLRVVSSTTASVVNGEEEVKNILLKQFTNSVRWIDTVNYMIYNMGVNCFIEVGPGKVLQGLIKKINPDVKTLGLEKPEDLDNIKGEI